MTSSTTRQDITWGYIATGLNIGSGLIVLPVVLRYLPVEEVGIWFVFLTLAGFAQILEGGFLSTLTRNTAYVYGGAQSLLHEGLPVAPTYGASINLQLLADLFAASRYIYRILATVSLLGLIGGGTYYLSTLVTDKAHELSYFYSWWCFATGYIITLYFGYYTAILRGRGDVAKANKVIAITRGSFLIIASVSLVLGFGLLGIGIASLLSCILGRTFARLYYKDPCRPEVSNIEHLQPKPVPILSVIWHNARLLSLATFSTFLIQRASILLASSFLGLRVAASFGTTITILITLTGISTVFLQIHMPQMSTLQSKGDKTLLRAVLGETFIVGWFTYLAIFVPLLFLGEPVLGLISSKVTLLPDYQLLALGIIFFLELNTGISGGYLTTTNKIPFVQAVFWSGFMIVIAEACLLAYSDLGVWSLIIAHGGVQLSWNYWKWFKESLAHVGGGLQELLKGGARRILLLLEYKANNV